MDTTAAIGIAVRQVAAATVAAAPSDLATAASPLAPACSSGNDYDGHVGVRISAIFVILIGSLFGAAFPVFARNNRGVRIPEWAFFVAKYFGSGVIIATAFIHLLGPAQDALTDPCLTGPITQYSWVEGIVLMTIFVLFFVELMAMRYSVFAHTHDDEGSSHARGHGPRKHPEGEGIAARSQASSTSNLGHGHGHTPGDDHLGHTRKHSDHDADGNSDRPTDGYAAQMTAIFILEFGIIFHSIFIGLTLAVSGWADFSTLYVVLVFHQTFEGLGLGSRLAVTPWPKGKRWTPYVMAVGYGVSTPIAIAVGLGVRQAYVPGSQTALLVNGVCDSISAGILIYTGLVELMAHEFMFSEVMRKAPLRVVLAAFGLMCLGAGLMALLGKWA